MALKFDLVIDQGSGYTVKFPVLDSASQSQNLTGWTVRGQARYVVGDPTVLHDFADELSTSGSDVLLTVPAAVSSAWEWSFAAYDIELIAPGGAVTRLVEGHVIVRPEVTR